MELATRVALSEGTFWDGSKKILRNQQAVFTDPLGPLDVEEVGYTKTKITLLKNLYIHEESLQSAVNQWEKRAAKKKYGSVGFSCYNHVLKAHSQEGAANRISSTMGPCLQAVTLTITKDKVAEVDVFYRTTEVFKKFPADLVLIRDLMLSRFDFTEVPLNTVTMHFSNMTVSPMYICTIYPLIDNPVRWLKKVKKADPRFHTQSLKWLHRYLTEEGQSKVSGFKQTRRVGDALRRLLVDEDQRRLVRYLNKENPFEE